MVVDVADGDVCLVGVIAQTVVAAHPHPQPAGQLAAGRERIFRGCGKNILRSSHFSPVAAVAGGDNPVGAHEGTSAHQAAANSALRVQKSLDIFLKHIF